MRTTVPTFLVLLAVACGGPATAKPVTSPATAAASASPAGTASSAPAPGTAFAVVFGGGPQGKSLTIVGSDGKTYGKASPRARSGDFDFQPWVSTSDTAAYYLDGDSALMRLRPGGSPEHVRDLPGTSSIHVAFAVSPDDRRIAVALLTYGPTPSGGLPQADYRGMKLYVEDFDGSHHIDLFDSPTVADWPVAWHGGDLIIAVSLKQIPGLGLNPNPYYAFGGMHVADAVTGTRRASLCGGTNELGPATPAGVLCYESGKVMVSDWAGEETPTGISDCPAAALQPGGASIACGDLPVGGGLLWSGASSRPLPASPIGWVGPGHLLLRLPQSGAELFDLVSGTTQPVNALVAPTLLAIPGGL